MVKKKEINFFVLDLNTEIPTINTIEREKKINKHHPVMILKEEELWSTKLKLSLKSYLKKYLEEYLKTYNIEMDETEKINLISSGRVYRAIFKHKKIFNKQYEFYLERDQTILKKYREYFLF